jgi:AcrR family transcriptional regulator
MAQAPKREGLTRERVLRAALALVDREGLEAISMRRLGQELGVEAMSLYNHVEGKAAILDGIFEAVLAELPTATPRAKWQAVVRERAQAFREVLSRHPHALPLFATRPAVTPASITQVETMLESLHEAGFPPDEALTTFNVLLAYVVGHTLATYLQGRPDETSHPDYDALSPAAFPRMREVARVLHRHDLDAEFEFGLEAMISGIAASRG